MRTAVRVLLDPDLRLDKSQRFVGAGGATWELLERVYEYGAGYSDVHVLHKEGKPYLGALFQRTIYEPGAEGGGYNLALASVPLK